MRKIRSNSRKRKRDMPRYFKCSERAPHPISTTISRRVQFCEVDAMGIVWNGNYLAFFENAATELRRRCGLSFDDFFDAEIIAPVVQSHVDYLKPMYLDESFTVRCMMVWTDAAKLNMEYEVRKEDESLATTGYTVQLFANPMSDQIFFVKPDILAACCAAWESGKLKELQ